MGAVGVPTASDDVCITADGSYPVTLTGAKSKHVTLGASGNLAQPTLRLTDPGGPSTLTSATGFTNHGSLVLETTLGYGDTLAISPGRSPTPPTAASASTTASAARPRSAARSSTTAPSRSARGDACRLAGSTPLRPGTGAP